MKNIKLEKGYIHQLKETTKQLNRYFQEILRQNGVSITSDQWELVKCIGEQEGINQREIAGITFKDPASVTRIIDILEKNGAVKRESIAEDRRSYALYLTNTGKSLVRKITPLENEITSKGLNGIKKHDQDKLTEILSKIHKNMS